MSFLSFHMDYYCRELEQVESSAVTTDSVYHAKQLLKILDDLLDEGYTGVMFWKTSSVESPGYGHIFRKRSMSFLDSENARG